MDVVAALIEKDKRFLLCQRPEGKALAGHWEFPGGKVEAHESKKQALVRECKEELDVILEVEKYLGLIQSQSSAGSLDLYFYLCHIKEGEIRKLEHMDIRWVRPEQLESFDLCPNDARFIKEILQPLLYRQA